MQPKAEVELGFLFGMRLLNVGGQGGFGGSAGGKKTTFFGCCQGTVIGISAPPTPQLGE